MDEIRVKDWKVALPPPEEVQAALRDYSQFMQHLLYNRNIISAEEAQRFLFGPDEFHDPFLLKGMDAAVDRLNFALDHGESMTVYGDYDVDGVTATALMVQALRALGAEVEAYFPNRFDEGYGVNREALAKLYDRGTKLIITVDCGIRSHDEVEYARTLGIDMVISDHHLPSEILPAAVAVVCQKQDGDEYPDKNLSGVGVAFKIVQALYQRRGLEAGRAEEWLDLVALGTVADVVPLTGENRTLVRAGLRRIRQSPRPGVASLSNVAGVLSSRLTATDIGFALGPRLNAAGRLESAQESFDLLMAKTMTQAGMAAQHLDDQNRERQKMTREMQQQAEALVGGQEYLLMVTALDFNLGVVGLVAAKLTESHYRPAVVGNLGEEFTRASCRSIPEFHITRALDECKDLLERYGGHALAAGFTVRTERLPELTARLQSIAMRELADKDLRPALRADIDLPLSDLLPAFLKEIDLLQPTGQDNREASFVSRGVKVKEYRTVGADRKHLKLTLTDGRITYDAIGFRMGHWIEQMPAKVDILYRFERNYYNGRETLQLSLLDLKPTE
jgi:single-stranded-DNA-specific exonuclease